MLEPHAPGARLVADDPAALQALRCEVVATLGSRGAVGVLYAVGFAEGRLAAREQIQQLGALGHCSAQPSRPPSPLLVALSGGALPTHFWGRLGDSVEARSPTQAEPTGCLVSAGYTAGFYSELLGETVLLREHRCRARGAPECRFEARTLRAWAALKDEFISDLLPFLQLPPLGSAPEDAGASAALEAEPEGFDDPGFDPTSPAVHVWGPLVILPFAGRGEAERAIASALGDTDQEPLRCAVVDLSGVRIDPLTLCALAQLLASLHDRDIEPIVLGLPPAQVPELRAHGALFGSAIFESELCHAIARGLQLSRASVDEPPAAPARGGLRSGAAGGS